MKDDSRDSRAGNLAEGAPFFLLAEYCPGPFYMGWHLYERERNDGTHNDDGSGWGWIRDRGEHSAEARVEELVRTMGRDPPRSERYRQGFAEWFAGEFPSGLRVRHRADGGYELVEVCQSRPAQKRHAIRTIRGAAISQAAARRRREKEGRTRG